MMRWSPEEDEKLKTAVLSGLTTRQAVAWLPGRSRHSLISRTQRLCLSFGPVKQLPADSRARAMARERARWAETRSAVLGKSGNTDCWDNKLFEPYAEFKARKRAERAGIPIPQNCMRIPIASVSSGKP